MKLSPSKIALSLMFTFGLATGVAQAQETGTPAKPAANTEKPAAEEPVTESTQEEGDKKAAEPFTVTIADGKVKFTAPGTWIDLKKKTQFVEVELKVPHVEADESDARLTFSRAGGSVTANVARWQGQFKQPDNVATSERTKSEKMKIADQDTTVVDIMGTFLQSSGGPFSGKPAVEKANYRMLAAIIATENDGQCFVKLIGPKATVDKNAEAFMKMVKSMQIVQ